MESALLTGTVANYLDKFISASKFRSVHICVGNHDKKKLNGEYKLAYDFYKNRENVHIYEVMTEADVSGHKVLFLPYYLGTNEYNLSMSDYYSDIPWNKRLTNKYDLVVGHFCGPEAIFPGSIDYVTNLDKINAKHIILGHIHTRYLSKERYIGSVFACKKNENDYTRSAIIIDDNNNRTEEELPLFNEFLSVLYPEDLPESKAIVPIYTILNCGTVPIANVRYGDIFIRRVTTDKEEAIQHRRLPMDSNFSEVKTIDIKAVVNSFFEDNKQYNSQIKSICLSMLKLNN